MSEEIKYKVVKIRHIIPQQFVGEDLYIYGPYHPGQVVVLPEGSANVIVRRGKGIIIRDATSEEIEEALKDRKKFEWGWA